LNTHNHESGFEKPRIKGSVEHGDNSREPAIIEAVDTNEASKIANLLQGLTFPATKEQIKEYIGDSKSISISVENTRNISQFIENKLVNGKEYNSTYKIEEALGLVVKKTNVDVKNKGKKENTRSAKERKK
jgi:hypothetical protein